MMNYLIVGSASSFVPRSKLLLASNSGIFYLELFEDEFFFKSYIIFLLSE